jgi:hypothetical protein
LSTQHRPAGLLHALRRALTLFAGSLASARRYWALEPLCGPLSAVQGGPGLFPLPLPLRPSEGRLWASAGKGSTAACCSDGEMTQIFRVFSRSEPLTSGSGEVIVCYASQTSPHYIQDSTENRNASPCLPLVAGQRRFCSSLARHYYGTTTQQPAIIVRFLK